MVASGKVGLAFGLNIAAGLATCIGALSVYGSKLASPAILATGLGFSAGVMLYVSFVDIFVGKGLAELEEPWGESRAFGWGTVLFFAGMIAVWLLHKILDHGAGYLLAQPKKVDIEEGGSGKGTGEDKPEGTTAEQDKVVKTLLEDESPELMRMGVLTAVAIALHNLPEGMVTFVGFLSDPISGIAIAIAIALHNIPEGVCVAMPIFYATGSRWKGFMWAALSGASEILGGLLAYAVVYGDRANPETFGALFCIVGGIMVYLCIFELIPTALKFDPRNTITSYAIVAGMGIMALSLIFLSL